MTRRRLRRKWKNPGTVSLFSFIDIIGGLIGALSLIILSLSLSHIVPESSSANFNNDQVQQLKLHIQQKNTQLDRMRKIISELSTQQADMIDARRQLGNLQQNQKRVVIEQSITIEALKEKRRLLQQIFKLEKKQGQLQTNIAELDKVANENKGNISRDKIEVHFAGRGKNLKPTFVECMADGLVIQDGTIKVTINNRIISTSDKFHLLLKEVTNRVAGTIIFLVRPDGIHSFNLALKRTKKYKVRTGKLPIPGSGIIDLNHYKE